MPRFYNHTKIQVTPEEIQHLEKELDIVLPTDYKQHLLDYNGGRTTCDTYYITKDGDDCEFFYFDPLIKGKKKRKQVLLERMKGEDYLPPKYHTIGRPRAGNLAMSFNEKDYGNIFVYFSDVELEKVAHSFTDFLNNLSNDLYLADCDPRGLLEEQYLDFVSTYQLDLPDAYRNFLYSYNGGIPNLDSFRNTKGDIFTIDSFFLMDKESITYIIKESDITTTAKAIEFIRDDWKIVSPSLFPFAAGLDGGFFIEMKGETKGSVFYIASEDLEKTPVLLADSFDFFIKNLESVSSFDL